MFAKCLMLSKLKPESTQLCRMWNIDTKRNYGFVSRIERSQSKWVQSKLITAHCLSTQSILLFTTRNSPYYLIKPFPVPPLPHPPLPSPPLFYATFAYMIRHSIINIVLQNGADWLFVSNADAKEGGWESLIWFGIEIVGGDNVDFKSIRIREIFS